MSFQKEIAKIKEKKFDSVYVLLGKERYLTNQFKQQLIASGMEEEEQSFNLMTFDMKQDLLDNVMIEAQTIPFFGERKIIFIQEPYFLTGEKKKTDVEHNLNTLLDYLDEPSPSTILVFLAPYDKLDERKKIVKKLKKEATLIDVSDMTNRLAQQYVSDTIKNEGYEISKEAFEEFIYLTNANLSQMMNELDKLFLVATESKKITKEMVKQLIPRSLEHSIFDLLKYILANQKEQSLALYNELLLQGEDPIKINAILISQFRLLLQVKIMAERHYQQSNMIDVLKIHPYRIKLSLQEAKKFDLKTLGAIFDYLVENDYKMKSGYMDANLLFELFLMKQFK
ncbi:MULTISPECIES: DNA polymerase III subunit delta [Enterococcaceae]|uniref:DNA polymerase III subunit delta n=1 Tax=Enterococcaceae TaxID=81852 RepID=UPI000E522D44|nr:MULTISPECIES: DNA polymerase III subunit delta [Enterococcaceae]MCI0130147.1 DNA polymerase III subunit delta [Vagococcus sp. CY53-2]RGI31010.1 DNA polymerase III subunit delta [Melissococcus sp. OM08-11BH]UNM88971.1 DNA polymerase III subunit delta [Vagococcus sp. CY52-2]